MKNICNLILFFFITSVIFGQNDPVLFSVENNPVKLSEFNYIYKKNNGDGANYSKASLEEYLDLYVKFKLKVQKAYSLRLDTVPALKQELEMYKKQLANSYLHDREIKEKLAEELYERMKFDINVSHVFVKLPNKPSPKDTLLAFNRIMHAKRALDRSGNFSNVVVNFSQDAESIRNNGNLGWVSALLPDGFYDLETLIYSLNVGETGGPVRSHLGYHLVKVEDKRPARGQMEAAHIYLKKEGGALNMLAKMRIDSLYQSLIAGKTTFEGVARKHSDDKRTSPKGGNIGVFGMGLYEPSFEEAAFDLMEGDISTPIETSSGFHIIKCIRKLKMGDLNQEKPRLRALLENDSRNEIATLTVIERVKKESNFYENKEAIKNISSLIEDDFITFRWNPPLDYPKQTLFSFNNDMKFSTHEFLAYLKKNTRIRLASSNRATPEEIFYNLYHEYVNESTLLYEEKNLKNKYPEFRELMREYEEGILLYEVTNQNVWSKANSDTIGLKKYFDSHREDYYWNDRAVVRSYVVGSTEQKLVGKILKAAKKKGFSGVAKKFNKNGELVSSVENKYLAEDPKMKELNWVKGFSSGIIISRETGTSSFKILESFISKEPKKLADAKGYIMADYQDHLEKVWIEQLRNEFSVKINDDVFNALIKK
jgi:peptidyl-prolyl cis-trans isomerase SurA